MPHRAKHGCAWPGCPALTNERYCETHAKVKQKEYDSRRGSSAERGYDYRWQRLRAMYLRAHPLCVMHAAMGETVMATDVDHIKPKSQGGDDSDDNLQSLCHEHHSEKTAKENNVFALL